MQGVRQDRAGVVSLTDDANTVEEAGTTASTQMALARARRERDEARHALKQAVAEVDDLTERLHLLEGVAGLNPAPPRWLQPKQTKKARRATVVSMLSDCHFDEVVRPDEVDGVNAYDRATATKRLERYFAKTITVSHDLIAGAEYDGIVLLLGGDMISGDIHEELSQTNEDTVLGTLLYWSELLSAGVRQLVEAFPRVHVASVVGNHGRRSRKPRAKLRARDNFDWLLSHLVARDCKGVKGVTWQIPEEADARIPVYDTNLVLTHGDQFRGGGGIGGIWPTIMRGTARKMDREQAAGNRMDHMIMGHWHQLTFGSRFTVNGSLKGTDEFAWTSNLGHEPAQQALLLVTPEHGITMRSPIIVQEPR